MALLNLEETAFFVGTFFLTSVVVHFVVIWRRQQRERCGVGLGLGRRDLQPLPCLPSLPFVGSLPFLGDFQDLPDYLMKKAHQMGPYIGIYVGSRLCLIANGMEAIRETFVRNPLTFADKEIDYIERNYTNKNARGLIMTRYDAEHKRRQQLSLSILKEFGFGVKKVMERRILTEVEIFTSDLHRTNGLPFDPKDVCHVNVGNVISGFLFGRKFRNDVEKKRMHRMLECVDDFQMAFHIGYVVSPVVRFVPSFRRRLNNGVRGNRELLELIGEELEATNTTRIDGDENDDEDVESFAKRFAAGSAGGASSSNEKRDREQLLYVLRDLFLAGSDTSATTLRWAFDLLANNVDVQRRLHREMDAAVTSAGDDRFPSMDDKPNLPYLDATILELMRIRTLLPMTFAKVTRVDAQVNGYFIPAGTMAMANLYSVHMDPLIWKDPNVFRPERFLEEGNDGKDLRQMIMPFSVGKRSCLGEVLARQELFLFLAAVVQRFRIELPDGVEHIDDTPAAVEAIIKPKPFQVKFIPRKRYISEPEPEVPFN